MQDRDDLSCIAAVAPDGNLYLPYMDALPAEGRTLADLRRTAEEKYQPVVKSARVTLVPVRFAAQVDALLEGLSQPGRIGAVFEAPVALDGRAAFPHLGFLPVAGQDPGGGDAAPAGELRVPAPRHGSRGGAGGRLLPPLDRARRDAQSRGLPGGGLRVPDHRAGARGRLAAERAPHGHRPGPAASRPRSSSASTTSAYDLLTAAEIQVAGGDLVFVPRTAITDLNVFVDQYLRRNIPIPIGVTVPFPGF